jgi:diguanylate cyclase (GGDEF)-like protein/PAS domain S-box-containing protein
MQKENQRLKELLSDMEVYSDRLLGLVEVLDRYVPGFRIDSEYNLQYTTESFCRLIGITPQQIRGKSIYHFFHPARISQNNEAMNLLKTKSPPFDIELHLISSSGNDIWINAHFEKWDSQTISSPGYTVVCENVTGIKYLEEVSLSDVLTGVANRRRINEVLAIETERSRRYGEPLSLIFSDLDNFKLVNDQFGHIIGDEILISFSAILRMQKRLTDTVGRWGGEEFVIIAPGTHAKDAIIIADRIQKMVETLPFNPVGRITASFGVTEFMKEETADDFVDRADQALYESKQRGKNTVTVF